MLKGLKSVDLKIIQMYHFRLKWNRYTVCTNWRDSKFFGVGFPLFPMGLSLFGMGVLNSCFQNPRESSDVNVRSIYESKHHVTNQYHPVFIRYLVNTLVGSKLLFTCIGHGNSTCFIAI